MTIANVFRLLASMLFVQALSFTVLNAQTGQQSEYSAGYLYTTISGINSSPIFNFDYSVSTYQLLTTSLRFEDKNERQKVNFAPLKLRKHACSTICELTLNISRSKDGSTFGFAHSYNPVAPYSERALKSIEGLSLRPIAEKESQDDYDEYRRGYYKGLDSLVERTTSDLLKTFILTYGVNVQLFPNIGGTEYNLDGDTLIDNRYHLRSVNGNVALTYSLGPKAAFSGSYFLTHKRLSSAQGQGLSPYHSFSLSGGYRIAILDRDYHASEAYKKKGFVPSIVIGAQLETNSCRGTVDRCEDRTSRTTVLTPFADIKITGESQLRLGIPFRSQRTAGKGSTELLPIFQFGFLLSSL